MLPKHLPEAPVTKLCHARHGQFEIAVAQVAGEWYSLISVNGSRPTAYPNGFMDVENAKKKAMLDLDSHARSCGGHREAHAQWNWEEQEDPSDWVRSFD